MDRLPPRKVPSKDDYYMGQAFWVAAKSKDPHTQMGAVLVSPDNTPLSTGYNGIPREIRDTDIDWNRPFKYDWIDHAEENALFFAKKLDTAGATIYLTGRTCKRCIRLLVKAGIKRVVCFPHKEQPGSMFNQINQSDLNLIEDIARKGNISIEQFRGNLNWMRDRMQFMQEQGIFDVF